VAAAAVETANRARQSLALVGAELGHVTDFQDLALVQDGVAGADEAGLAVGADRQALAVVEFAGFRRRRGRPGVFVDVAAGLAAAGFHAEDHRAADVAAGRVEDPQLEGRRGGGGQDGYRDGEQGDPLHPAEDSGPIRRIELVLFLLRHGDAEAGNGDDAARRLTPKGERQAEAAGRALAALGAGIDACLTSPKVRAAETARLACRDLGPEPEVAEELRGGPFDSPSLSAGRANVLLVGHEPDFSGEIGRLTGANAKLRKGGLAIVDGSTLVALLRPKDLEAIASGSASR
jgi:phosphohistidine phosphatase